MSSTPKDPNLRKPTTKLQGLLDGPLVKKVLQGRALQSMTREGDRSVDCTSDLYPDTLVLSHARDDGANHRHLHRGFECYSLVSVYAGVSSSGSHAHQNIKRHETSTVRMIDTKTTVLLTGASNDDTLECCHSNPCSPRWQHFWLLLLLPPRILLTSLLTTTRRQGMLVPDREQN